MVQDGTTTGAVTNGQDQAMKGKTNGHVNGHNNPLKTEAPAQSVPQDFVWPTGPTFDDPKEERRYLKERLALAYRVFAHHGLFSGAAGHLSLRDPIEKDCFWVTPFGRHFSMMRACDLLMIDHHGKVIAGGLPDKQIYNQAAATIHIAIHQARPDANAVCHSHSPYGKAFSAFARELPLYTQDSCVFYNDCAVYKQHGGVVLDPAESGRIVDALGSKKAIILANHGLLTVGGCIESATQWFIELEQECEVAMTVEAAAASGKYQPQIISDQAAAFTYKVIGHDAAGRFEATPYFDQIEEMSNGAHKL